MTLTPQDRLITALDLPSVEEAARVVAAIGEEGQFYKIGYQLFPIGGYDFARQLGEAGKKIFLDLKLFDIGATVERGVKSLSAIGGDILTVHADTDVIKGALNGRVSERLKIFAVTVLTSWDQSHLNDHGIGMGVLDLVLLRAEMAAEAGADGVIASAAEAKEIRARLGDALEIVTPGIRPAGVAADDQKRVITPGDAIKAGADRLVVGRPIVKADDPALAAKAILTEISQSL
ncbi:orotidine-5'-phosphate decarboxylase [Parvularcula marina]|uniref:orotidine-5'-phosphate decarboxylase n=1 Tax=Parvularcula marina TaxID=2292771 RepID=UPI0035186040